MGRLTRCVVGGGLALALAGATLGGATAPAPVRAGGGFDDLRADATFGVEMTFNAAWDGTEPDRFELLLGFGGEERLVIPVEPAGGALSHRRDMAESYAPPNTVVSYQWRAVEAGTATVSAERTLLYDDDRAGFAWEQARIGSATVHWYGPNEDAARRFGELAGDAANAAAGLLGRDLANPIDIFVYDTREGFFGAVGQGAREWTGAATYPHIRTVFMWLGAGSGGFLDTAVVHEVTHVVFHDATTNPFHDPASWFNEGVATWSELGNADAERDLVELEAGREDGLMAFEALTDQFPIDARGASLAYAQGATMVDLIIETHGSDAIADMATAYRAGATDAEAVEVGTGAPFDDLKAEYFASFGVAEPVPVTPRPLMDSNVPLPIQPDGSGGLPPDGGPANGQDASAWLIIGVMLVGIAVGGGVLVVRARRRGRG
jgi:hypothetical protein